MACYNRWERTAPGGAVRLMACGQCRDCRLEKSRQWAMRCIHEAQLHEANSFVTLTYNEEHLPKGETLVYRDFQLFMKRLRKKFSGGLQGRTPQRHLTNEPSPRELSGNYKTKLKDRNISNSQTPIRFYMSGEYGEKNNRPHYHAILFGIAFTDRVPHKKSPSGEQLYTSETLDKIWAKGFASVGEVTFNSAAYVARYVMKKITGKPEKNQYEKINEETGEITNRKPEFGNMSRRPGIGAHWIKKFHTDVYPHGMTVINGLEVRPPKYYDRWYKNANPRAYAKIQEARYIETLKNLADSDNSRLAAKEAVKTAALTKLKRKL